MDLGLGHLGPRTGTFAGGPGSGLGQNWALNRAHRPLGPVWPAQPAQRRPFSVFVLTEFSNFEKKKKSQHLGAFFPGTIFFTFFAGSRGSSGTQNQRQNSKFQNPLSRPEKYTLPADPSSPAFWGLLELKMLYGPRPRALGAPHWHFCRRSGLRFGSKLGPEPGTPPTGPRVARTAGPKKAFFRFCLNRIFEF